MSGRVKFGTWNLERSGVHHRGRMVGQLACLAERNCDVWVLTETHDDLRPAGYDSKVEPLELAPTVPRRLGGSDAIESAISTSLTRRQRCRRRLPERATA